MKLSGTRTITVDLFRLRQILLETLRTKNIMWLVLEQDNRADSASKPHKVLAVLNTRFYQTGDRIWLAQQLVDMRTNRNLWSGIYVKPLFKSTQDPEDDTRLTTGS